MLLTLAVSQTGTGYYSQATGGRIDLYQWAVSLAARPQLSGGQNAAPESRLQSVSTHIQPNYLMRVNE